jgi:ATP-binding cassette, subfamily C, bacterial CydC
MRLLGLIAPFRNWVAMAVLLSFLTVAAGIALMATSAYLISKAALASEVAALTLAITSVRVFAISRGCFRYLERLVSHKATFKILEHLRAWFYAAIEPLAPARLLTYRSGDVLARSVADVETLQNFYVRVVVPPLAAALGVILACAILALFDWSLAAMLFLFLLLSGIALPLTMHRLGAKTGADIVAVQSELNAVLVDEVQGTADLLVFDLDEHHRGKVLRLNHELERLQERMALLRGVSNGLSVAFAGLAIVAVVGLAVPLVSGDGINPIYLALLPLTAMASFEAVQPLAPALQQLSANQAAGRRIFELIDAPPEVIDPTEAAEIPADTNIAFSNVSFRYDDEGPAALQGVTFAVPPGQRIGIAGPSGSGKSTIVNLLLRFWDYHSGEITLGGLDLRDYRSEDVRSLISVVPQDVHLFNASIRDNLLLANPDANDEEIVASCRIALLGDFIPGLPEGYDTRIGENGLLLSGGERQRLAIARAVLKASPIVILDEPTANLDPETERKLMHSLEPFLGGRSVLLISHRPAVLECVDLLLTMENGRIIDASARAEAHSIEDDLPAMLPGEEMMAS